MTEKIQDFVDKLATGDNAGAGEAFKDALRDKVATSLDAQRQDIAGKIFNGVPEPEAHSDPKPAVTEPSPKTDQMMDTTGQEIEFTPNTETPTAEAPVSNDESQPSN
jgi:hypothetical protein|tara:strand:+ start:674 stop:994 length:321 start_codon:yes stop_codon:yes gene_type:complete